MFYTEAGEEFSQMGILPVKRGESLFSFFFFIYFKSLTKAG